MTNVIIINAKEKTKTEVQITNQDLTEYLKKELGENFCYGHSNGNNETLCRKPRRKSSVTRR